MEKYISQLLADIEVIILQRWQTCVPHFYSVDTFNPYLKPPDGWQNASTLPVDSSDLETTAAIMEMENWLHGKAELSMFYHFGLSEQQFPPPNRLSDDQLAHLVFILHRLWNAFNFMASVPKKAPNAIVYTTLLKRMLEPVMVMKNGVNGIEFCDYEPTDCPFGGYCDCGNEEF